MDGGGGNDSQMMDDYPTDAASSVTAPS